MAVLEYPPAKLAGCLAACTLIRHLDPELAGIGIWHPTDLWDLEAGFQYGAKGYELSSSGALPCLALPVDASTRRCRRVAAAPRLQTTISPGDSIPQFLLTIVNCCLLPCILFRFIEKVFVWPASRGHHWEATKAIAGELRMPSTLLAVSHIGGLHTTR